MPLSFQMVLISLAQEAWYVFSLTWWVIVPVLLAGIFWRLWMFHIRTAYVEGMKWSLLRIKTPQDNAKTPKAMEQIFTAVHGSYSFGVRPKDKYWKGVVENWHTFEIVGDATGVRFYIRTPEAFRNMVESAVYSHYPGTEIELVEDYIADLPVLLPNNTFDLFGTEFVLARDDGYPIKTYPDFDAQESEEKLDSISTIVEVLSKLKGNERIWLQLLIRPNDNSWKKKADALRDKLAGRKEEKKLSVGEKAVEFLRNLVLAPIRDPEWAEESKPEKPMLGTLTRGEQEIIKAIEDKQSKMGFDSVLRFLYVSEKAEFDPSNISSIMGALRQFNTLHLNGFKPNLDAMTITRGVFKNAFKKQRVYAKKRNIYDAYKFRDFPDEFSILNIEELATLYHFPSFIIESPGLQPIEFKRGAPPPNLPTQTQK